MLWQLRLKLLLIPAFIFFISILDDLPVCIPTQNNLLIYLLNKGILIPLSKIKSSDLFKSYLVELYSAGTIAVLGLAFSQEIAEFLRKLFKPLHLKVRMPFMISTTPILVAIEENFWRNNGIEVEIDWKYAGRAALDDLERGECDIAVASDYAIIKFLSNYSNLLDNVYILPFAILRGHIKVVARENVDSSRGPIAYYENSVHEDFLKRAFSIDISGWPKVKSTLDGISKLSGSAVGFAVWEPHYQALRNIVGLKLEPNMQTMANYEWALCLLIKRHTVETSSQKIAEKLLEGLEIACIECKTSPGKAIRMCLKYYPQELAGLSENDLQDISGIEFGTKESFVAFKRNLERFRNDDLSFYAGMVLQKAVEGRLWPGLEVT